MLYNYTICVVSVFATSPDVRTRDMIFDGIRFDSYWLHSTQLSLTNNVSEYNNPCLRRCRVSTTSLDPVFLCIINDKRTWSFEGKVFGSSSFTFWVIHNTLCAFNPGNVTLPLLAIWHWTIHDNELNRLMSISSFD